MSFASEGILDTTLLRPTITVRTSNGSVVWEAPLHWNPQCEDVFLIKTRPPYCRAAPCITVRPLKVIGETGSEVIGD